MTEIGTTVEEAHCTHHRAWRVTDFNVKTIYTDGYRYSYVTGLEGRYRELFDLGADPNETDDRGGTIGHSLGSTSGSSRP